MRGVGRRRALSQLCPSWVFRYAAPLLLRWWRGGMIDFKGTQFEKEIILWGVRWYVAYPISYRQLEEMMGAGCLRRSLHPQSVGHQVCAGGGKTAPPLPAPCGPQLAAPQD